MKGQPISVDLSATWRRFTRCRCRFGNSNVFFAHSSQNVALLPTQRPVIWSSGTSSKYLCHPPGGARSNLDVAKYSPISLFLDPFTFVSKLANFPLRKVLTFDTVVKFKICHHWILQIMFFVLKNAYIICFHTLTMTKPTYYQTVYAKQLIIFFIEQ